MKLTYLTVKNFRALRDVSIPLSRFGCLIGENNAGKSTILTALSLFFSGTKLAAKDYFDETSEISIAVTFEGITDADLARLVDEHRNKISGIIKNGCLILVRSYKIDSKSLLCYQSMMPNEDRFSRTNIDELLKNYRAGVKGRDKILETIPELVGRIDEETKKDGILEAINNYTDELPDDKKISVNMPLPTGMDRSIIPMLPEPIYIPAVKDLSDDIKTAESAPFGKILSILLESVVQQLPDVEVLFKGLNEKLNIVYQNGVKQKDVRLDYVKLVESTVKKYVQQSFADIDLSITIPPPELKAFFSSAQIYVDDGVSGLIESKGDGLRRAVVFSILRSCVDLKAQKEQLPEDQVDSENGSPVATKPYLLLFEEPELYLHPKAQSLLFDALRDFATSHHVLVTTHSPMFFNYGSTETFIKLRRESDDKIASKPFTKAQAVDLSKTDIKDQFQMICYENNNAAFFADTVVLVEGDSDHLLYPHIARTLNPDWDVMKTPVHFTPISGKGNIRRYRKFFKNFDIRVLVIADLDLLLNGFQQIDASDDLSDARDILLQAVDSLTGEEQGHIKSSSLKPGKAHTSGELRKLWGIFKEKMSEYKIGNSAECAESMKVAGDEFFAWVRRSDRLDILKTSKNEALLDKKWALLDALRQEDIYVLEHGAIEDYYPDSITGPDKPSKAINFCNTVNTKQAVMDCCGSQRYTDEGELKYKKEFMLIFERIFAS